MPFCNAYIVFKCLNDYLYIMEKLFDEVASIYLETNSVNKTSQRCNISRTKVRKVLITVGLLSSPLINDIKELINKGMDNNQICHYLNISRSIYNENTGYIKGIYNGDNRSKQALRSERFHIKEAIYKERFKKLREESKR